MLERDGDTIVLRVPLRLTRRSGRKEIILSEHSLETKSTKSTTETPLLTALARADFWQELIDTGKYHSVTELATALKLDRSYVSRILRLTLLAPDIVEQITDGREPSGLSLGRLAKPLPPLWAEQRKRFGFRQRRN